jgi:hypothetical protein
MSCFPPVPFFHRYVVSFFLGASLQPQDEFWEFMGIVGARESAVSYSEMEQRAYLCVSSLDIASWGNKFIQYADDHPEIQISYSTMEQ